MLPAMRALALPRLRRAAARLPAGVPRGRAVVAGDLAETPSDSRLFYDNPTYALVRRVKARGGWKAYTRHHKRVLVGLVAKCKPIPDDAAGLVVEFYCPVGGS